LPLEAQKHGTSGKSGRKPPSDPEYQENCFFCMASRKRLPMHTGNSTRQNDPEAFIMSMIYSHRPADTGHSIFPGHSPFKQETREKEVNLYID
jgi:hypothetical protein